MKQKHSAIDLTELAIGIVILGVVVSIGALVVTNVRDNRLTELSTVQTINETTFINATTDTLANTWVKSVDSCINSTSNKTIVAANWTATISPIDGTATLINASSEGWDAVKCTYTWYNTSRADYKTADQAATGIAEYGSWFKIIVIVGAAALVLGIIFMAFGRNQSQGASY